MPRIRSTPLLLVGCCLAPALRVRRRQSDRNAATRRYRHGRRTGPGSSHNACPNGCRTTSTSAPPAAPAQPTATAGVTAQPPSPVPAATIVPTATAAASPTAAPAPTAGPPQQHTLPGGTITLPAGFTIDVYASSVGQARFMAVRPSDGVLFVADANGRILALPDANHDGKPDSVTVFASGLNLPSSIAFYQDWVYVGETNQVSRFSAPNNAMQAQGNKSVVIPNLPPPTDHWTRTVAFGPDGKLYLAIGSDCNVCIEKDDRRAAISVYDPDGTNGRLFATGLRNAVGFTWQPGTNQMWATVNGRDSIGDDIPPDDLRAIKDGTFYGWPYCYNGTTPEPRVQGPHEVRERPAR